MTVKPYSAGFFRYAPLTSHPDTLVIDMAAEVDPAVGGNTWGASAIIMEKNGGMSVEPVPINKTNGSGRFELANWKDFNGCLLVVTNVSRNSNGRKISAAPSWDGPISRPGNAIAISHNVVKLSSAKPIVISGGDIAEIKILSPEGRVIAFYNSSSSKPSIGGFQKRTDGAIEWYPGKRLVPGVCYVMASSGNKKSVHRRKVMILP
jgi:hypothetical protein